MSSTRWCVELRKVLRPAGTGASLLWRTVMPRVPEALARFQAMGMKLVIVSNSDGTVERSITDAGLRPFFSVVVDSAIAGYEKPDPRIFAHALEALRRHSRTHAARRRHLSRGRHRSARRGRACGYARPIQRLVDQRLPARARRVGCRRSVGAGKELGVCAPFALLSLSSMIVGRGHDVGRRRRPERRGKGLEPVPRPERARRVGRDETSGRLRSREARVVEDGAAAGPFVARADARRASSSPRTRPRRTPTSCS